MNEQNTEVQKVDPSKLPAFIGSAALGKGHEDETESSDFIIPRAKLVQYTAEEVTAENAEDRVEPGCMINSITKEKLDLVFIPIYRYKSYAKWNPMDKRSPDFDSSYEPGEMIFSTTDKNDERIGTGLEFGDGGEPPKVTETFNYLSMFPGQAMPLILSFKRTSIKAAKNMNTMMQLAGGDMFSNKFRLIISKHEEGQRKWFSLDVRGAGKCTDEEHTLADSVFEHFRGKGPSVATVVEAHAAPEEGAAKDAGWDEKQS